MIRFNCPSCGAKICAPDEKAGMIGKCSCGERVRVPDTPSSTEQPVAMGDTCLPASSQLSSASAIPKNPDSSEVFSTPPNTLMITPKKWVVIIAAGVVVGLFTWTFVDKIVSGWRKASEHNEKRTIKKSKTECWDALWRETCLLKPGIFNPTQVEFHNSIVNNPNFLLRVQDVGQTQTLLEERDWLLLNIKVFKDVGKSLAEKNQQHPESDRKMIIISARMCQLLENELQHVNAELERR